MRRGNPNLKAAHEKMEITYEQIREMQRCMLDPIYFIKNYVYITHPKMGSIKFDLYDYQEELINNYHNERYNIVLSARQTGKTETSCAYMVWWAIFQEDKTVLVVSKDSESAKEIIKRVQQIYEELPHWLKPGIQDDDWNKHTAAFDNRSRIVARTTTSGSGRGLSISLMYCDELAFVKPTMQEAFWTSVFPTLSCVSGDTIVLSENGMSRIRDTISNNLEVGKLEESQIEQKVYTHMGLQPVSHNYISPASKTLTVETETGRTLTVTPHHPLMKLCHDGRRLTKTEEMVVGDYLRVDTGMNIFGNKSVSEDEAYMLGGYIAEGWINQNNTIWISNTDTEFREVYLKNGFVEDMQTHKIRMSSRSKIQEWVDIGMDCDRKCYNKIIPKDVLKFDKQSMCHFLAGMFDGDGSVTDRSINYTSSSNALVRELQIILDNYGIISKIYKNDSDIIMERDKDRILPHGKKLQYLNDSWSLNIPLSQYSKFKQIIPIKIKRKVAKLDEVIYKRKQDDFKQYYVPVEPIKDRLLNIISFTGKSKDWFRLHCNVRFDKILDRLDNRKLTVDALKRFINGIEEYKLPITNYNLKFLHDLAIAGVRWEKIKDISESYCDRTYDFTVPGASTFIQNGIMGSNTGGKCIITSTPNGDTDLFSTMWRGAEAETNGFVANRIYWDQPPGRDEKFKERQIAALGERQWLQEYECLSGSVYVTVKNLAGNIIDITLQELYSMLGKKKSEQ